MSEHVRHVGHGRHIPACNITVLKDSFLTKQSALSFTPQSVTFLPFLRRAAVDRLVKRASPSLAGISSAEVLRDLLHVSPLLLMSWDIASETYDRSHD